MEALISIIIPVYNVEKYLDACIQSVAEQTYSNLEIILVDDGSLDCSPQICDAWAERDARIRVLHKQNGGAASARNAGLEIATGEYIGFIDSDDIITPNMYELLINALDGESIGIACCRAQLMAEDGTLLQKDKICPMYRMCTEEALNAVFTFQVSISLCTKLYHREVLQGIRLPVGETNEEACVTIPTIVRAKGLINVQDVSYFYRQREGSVTSKSAPSEKNSDILYRNFQRMRAQLKEYGFEKNKNFLFYEAAYSLWRGVSYEKNYRLLTPKVRNDYKVYRKILWKNALAYLCSGYSSIKEKILYVLVLTKLLRPVYKVFFPDRC